MAIQGEEDGGKYHWFLNPKKGGFRAASFIFGNHSFSNHLHVRNTCLIRYVLLCNLYIFVIVLLYLIGEITKFK